MGNGKLIDITIVCDLDLQIKSKNVQIIGSLLYFINFTQPNIECDVCRLNKYTHNPNHDHWGILVTLKRYLRVTMSYDIMYSEFLALLEE